MASVYIYEPSCLNFENNGLGSLAPIETTVKKIAGGQYELQMLHPLDAEGRWRLIGHGCVIKAMTPVRESPGTDTNIRPDTPLTVRRDIYQLTTGSRVATQLRTMPGNGQGAVVGRAKKGDDLILIDKSSAWYKVLTPDGLSGYLPAKYLKFIRSEDETVKNRYQQISRRIFAPNSARWQLYRVYTTEIDTERHQLTAKAMHITYDLRVNPIPTKIKPKNPNQKTEYEDADAKATLDECWSRLANAHNFTLHDDNLTGTITGDFAYKNGVELLLDPDEGIAAQTGCRIVRDNFDIWVLPDAEQNNGVTIRRGKNLIGVTANVDISNVVTRIIPIGVGQNDDDRPGVPVDSEHINDYPIPLTKVVKYDDIKYNSEYVDYDDTRFNEKLRERALEDYANGADQPEYTLEVDFVALGEEAYNSDYAKLQAVFLYDTVTVIDSLIGLKAQVRLVEYEWDALGLRYNKVKLGDIGDVSQTVYSYNLPTGGVSGSKLQQNSTDGSALRDLSLSYAKISNAAIDQLNANTITAYRADIERIAAGQISAERLVSALAEITAMHVGSLTADEIKTDRLAAALAQFGVITAGNAEFDRATVQHLISSALNVVDASADKVFIENLAVDYASIISADVRNLCIRAADGNYYRLTIDELGNIVPVKTTVSAGEIDAGSTTDGKTILETNIVASQLSASGLKAVAALINRLDAARIDVGTLVATNAFAEYLQTANIASNTSLTFTLQSLKDDIQGVLRQEDMPDTGLPTGSLWIKPSNGYLYQLTTEGILPDDLDVAVDNGLSLLWDGTGDTYTQTLTDGSLIISYSDDASVRFTLLNDLTLKAETISWKRVRDSEIAGLSDDMTEIHRYMSFTDEEGLVQRDPNSVYYTRIDEDGFDVCSDIETEPIATLNADDGLKARRITLGSVVCKATTTGGWAWQAQEA